MRRDAERDRHADEGERKAEPLACPQALLRQEEGRAERYEKRRRVEKERRVAGARPLQPDEEREELEREEHARGDSRPEGAVTAKDVRVAPPAPPSDDDRAADRADRRLGDRRHFGERELGQHLLQAPAHAAQKHQGERDAVKGAGLAHEVRLEVQREWREAVSSARALLSRDAWRTRWSCRSRSARRR